MLKIFILFVSDTINKIIDTNKVKIIVIYNKNIKPNTIIASS